MPAPQNLLDIIGVTTIVGSLVTYRVGRTEYIRHNYAQ